MGHARDEDTSPLRTCRYQRRWSPRYKELLKHSRTSPRAEGQKNFHLSFRPPGRLSPRRLAVLVDGFMLLGAASSFFRSGIFLLHFRQANSCVCPTWAGCLNKKNMLILGGLSFRFFDVLVFCMARTYPLIKPGYQKCHCASCCIISMGTKRSLVGGVRICLYYFSRVNNI